MKKLVLALVLAAGCTPSSTSDPVDPPKKSDPDPAPAPAAAPAPAPKQATEMKAHPSPEGVIRFSVPKAWKLQEPSNNMRKAQYGIPDKEGKEKDGELTLFYFGPSRRNMEANIERWKGQVEGASGEPEKMKGKCAITLLDLSGAFAGGFGVDPIADARMLAAVVEAEDGPWYFKATGPAATIGDWREEFIALLKGAHK